MDAARRIASILVTCCILAACASSKITRQREYGDERFPRPDRIWVHDFAATQQDVHEGARVSTAPQLHAGSQTPEQAAAGRKAGAEVAAQLVQRITAMGMPADRAAPDTQPRVNDIVIRGYLLSVQEGDATQRMMVGFGQGASELRVVAEGYRMTDRGLRRLGSGTVEAAGSKAPGEATSIGMAVASGNPAGLIVSTGVKLYEEETGASKLEGRAKAVAEEIAAVLEPQFREQGWID